MSYKNEEDRRAYHRRYMKDRRDLLKEHGLCSECKKQDAYTIAGRPRCFECQSKRWKQAPEYIKPEKQVIQESFRLDPTRCYLCGAPVLRKETAFGGEPIKVCAKHYELMKRIAKKGRDAYKERHGETWGQTQYRISQNKRKSSDSARSLLPFTSYSRCAMR